MFAPHAGPFPQRQTGAAALVSHHSPAAQQPLPQQMPDVHTVQLAAHERLSDPPAPPPRPPAPAAPVVPPLAPPGPPA